MGVKTLTQHIDDIRMDLATWIMWPELDPEVDWTDDDIERAVKRAYSDLSRYLPREMFYEVTLGFTVTDESFTSAAAHGTYVSLANHPVSKATGEIVKNAGGTVTYKRDIDYTFDYMNGKITTISGGAMAVNTAYKITYTKSKISVDLSALSPIRVEKVEYPAHNVPQKFVRFSNWNNVLFIEGGEDTQANLSQSYHATVYYHAMHTVPTISVAGTCPEVLEDTVNLAAEAYCLFIKAERCEHDAFSDLVLARDALENLAALHNDSDSALNKVAGANTDAETALDQVAVYALEAKTDLDKIDAKITAAESALGNLAAIHSLVGTDLTSANTAFAAATTALTALSTPLSAVDTALAKIDTYLAGGTESTKALLAQIATDAAALRTAIGTAVDAANAALDAVATDLTAADGVWATSGGENTLLGTTGIGFLNTGDDLINAVNIGADAPNLYSVYCQAVVAMAAAWAKKRADFINDAQARTQSAVGYLQEASSRLSNLSSYIDQARAYGVISDGFAQEANQRLGKCNALINQANQDIGIGNGYVSTAGMRLYQMDRYLAVATAYANEGTLLNNLGQSRLAICDRFIAEANQRISIVSGNVQDSTSRIAEMDRYLEEAARYTEAATADMALADKYRSAGVDKRNEVYSIWQDSKHFIGDLSTISIRQQVSS